MSGLPEPCFLQQIPFHPAVGWVVLVTVWEMDPWRCELCWTERSLGRQLWLVHPLWCGGTNSTNPGNSSDRFRGSCQKNPAHSLPQFLLLLLAAQMVSPAVKDTFNAFRRKQRESVLGMDHKCCSCYSPVICQQAVGVWMVCWTWWSWMSFPTSVILW